MLGGYDATSQNYGGSITKSMLPVAYLQQIGDGTLSPEAQDELESMIEVSENDAADWAYDHLSSPNSQVQSAADSVGTTGFQLDTSDPVYVSRTVAGHRERLRTAVRRHRQPDTHCPAKLWHGPTLPPLLSRQVGLLQAGLHGVVYSKEGWKPKPSGLEGAPYNVNEAGQLWVNGSTYGVAFTVAGVSDRPSGEAVIERIAAALA